MGNNSENTPFAAGVVCLLLVCAIGLPFLSTRGVAPPSPPAPAIMRDVATVNESGTEYTYPVVPPYRTSVDGRVALNMKKKTGGTFRLNLLRPESVANPVIDLPAGAHLFAYNTDSEFRVNELDLFNRSDNSERVHHITLCDRQPNTPTASNDNGTLVDTYELQVLSSVYSGTTDEIRMWGTPLTVQVANPKTANAEILSFELGTPIQGPELPGIRRFFEPMTTEDGLLLFGRASGSPMEKQGEYSGRYDIAYAVAPEGSDRCDVTAWTEIRPFSYMPHDPEVQGRYDIAKYPFRDSEGNLIEKGERFAATYPWMDRKARNVFLFVDNSTLYYEHEGTNYSRFPARCVGNTECDLDPENLRDVEDPGRLRGLSVVGSWTHGKVVTIDGILNHLDYGLAIGANRQREVLLYEGDDGEVWVRTAAGRDNTDHRMPLSTNNTTFVDSFENQFNMHSHIAPATLRDVVWQVNRGTVSDEVVFDDFMDLDVLIFSEMQASWTKDGAVHNGFRRALQDQKFTHSAANSTIRLQNSASSPRLDTPVAGIVKGAARIEPVALGGIYGKGLFLDTDASVTYELTTSYSEQGWYAALFLDSRNDSSEPSELLSAPDGSSILFNAADHELSFLAADGKNLGTYQIPAPVTETGGWNHFGFAFRGDGRVVRVYIDGLASKELSWEDPAFQLEAGDLVFGDFSDGNIPGIRGWIDEIRVHLLPDLPTHEEHCNFARGTMVGMNEMTESNETWWLRAEGVQASLRRDISDQLVHVGRPEYARYACFTDYTKDHGVSLNALPADTFSIRQSQLFPESPLLASLARPDSTKNSFCASCHTDSSIGTHFQLPRPSGLSHQAALSGGSNAFATDTRRQPNEGPQFVYGHVPAGWIEGRDLEARPASPSSGPATTSWWTHADASEQEQPTLSAHPGDIDTDGDGLGEFLDNDDDDDGIRDELDSCPKVRNRSQLDRNENGIGDACEERTPPDTGDSLDSDGDSIPDDTDNCPLERNRQQADADGDGAGNACDQCPRDPLKVAPGACGCGVGDLDLDNDGVSDCSSSETLTLTEEALAVFANPDSSLQDAKRALKNLIAALKTNRKTLLTATGRPMKNKTLKRLRRLNRRIRKSKAKKIPRKLHPKVLQALTKLQREFTK